MSYATLSNACQPVSVAILSNRKYISPTSPLYALYPVNNCPLPKNPICCCGANEGGEEGFENGKSKLKCKCTEEINRYHCCQNALCENKSCC